MVFDLSNVIDDLTSHLDNNVRISYGNPLAAVLIPLFEKSNAAHVLLTQRASDLRKHSGQISFPGGKIEDQDISIVDTAIRETEEEIGLEKNKIDVIALFHDFATPYYAAVTPIIGRFDYPQPFVLQEEEIDRILEVPLHELSDPSIYHSEVWEHEGKEYDIHFYDWEDETGETHNIWGATAGVLKSLLDILQK